MNFTPKYFIGYIKKMFIGHKVYGKIYHVNKEEQFPNLMSALSHMQALQDSPKGEVFKYEVFELRKVT